MSLCLRASEEEKEHENDDGRKDCEGVSLMCC